MTNPNLTEIITIVDRSGSMQSIRDDAIGGFNAFLADQQEAEGECKLTYCQFDNEYEVIHNGKPIKEVPFLDAKTFVPRNSTALLDAIGKMINTVGERLAKTPEQDRPSKVVVVILTDGQENASQEFTRQTVFDMIKHQQGDYQWEFVFLAANQDAFAAGAALGIANAANFSHDAKGMVNICDNLSASVRSYRKSGLSADLKVKSAGGGKSSGGVRH